ncbi:hypothetical protein ACEQUB_p00261 (plasmid) [Ralstonia syzygii]|uniref:Uncharacterized protein n=1 Tax=Ralstonia syzygii R24 TaxID=907261 RepID=G3A9Q4_9RALS|nr:hypothetical protein RALSY_mp10555 [Ralstonia syzygii R24]
MLCNFSIGLAQGFERAGNRRYRVRAGPYGSIDMAAANGQGGAPKPTGLPATRTTALR